MKFSDFNFNEHLFEGIDSMGFREATPIQEQTIPLALEGNDLIACAQTGTGKTASYLLPVINSIVDRPDRSGIGALILAPTRELAVQIDQQVEGLAYFTGVSSIAVYGGGDGIGYEQQRRSLREGVDLVIATPGRLIAHINSGVVDWKELKFLVLDEADRMLDMGFKDDILKIVNELPKVRQTLLFSATMPPKIRSFASLLLREPKEINIAISQPAEKIDQRYYEVFDEQKVPLIQSILKTGGYKSVILFASTKEKVKDLYKALRKINMEVRAFHSDLTQAEREDILLGFKNRKISVLVGTDVLSRGIDVEGIELVVNFDVPPDPEDYIHRIGRTARAERTGTAITFVNGRDRRRFERVEKLMERKVNKADLPEELGAPPIFEALENNPKRRKKKKRFNNKKGKPQSQSA